MAAVGAFVGDPGSSVISAQLDVPEIESAIVESLCEHGPFGVKSIGEPPMTPTMVCVAIAVADAAGARVNQLPLTPDAFS